MRDGNMEIKLENTDFMKRAISELEKGVDKDILEDIGYTMGEALGTYAPEVTGALRQAYDIKITKNNVDVTWDGPTGKSLGYAKYQFYGVAMQPVAPIFEGDATVTDKWRTKKGTKKRITPDKHYIGEPKEFVIEKGKHKGKTAVIKGYTKKGSTHHWIDKARNTPTVYRPMRREVYERLADAIGEKIVGKRYYT